MRTPIVKSTREEIKQKLLLLYSNSLDVGRNVLDFDKKYDFFSMDESLVLKYSSNWFRPEKYSFQSHPLRGGKHYQVLGQDEGGVQKFWPHLRQDSLLKVEKPVSTNLTRDLEVLGRTPYQIGVDGEKFRVVAATLQKCNSPFVRRTFHFTSNGIVEAPEKKSETEALNAIPFLKQTKTVVPPQKLVRIRRFRVIKKNDLAVEKYILPQKIKITNGEKTRFITVRVRPKNSNLVAAEGSAHGTKLGIPPSDMQKFVITAEDEPEIIEANATLAVQTEDTSDDIELEQVNLNTSEADTSSASLDLNEEERSLKPEEVHLVKQEENHKEEKSGNAETFNCDNCGKQFPTYLSCLAHIRSHQRQVCQFCSKKFLTAKMLRDHVKMQHQHRVTKSGTSEDRITTATSKFGRTRQVLNVAGLRRTPINRLPIMAKSVLDLYELYNLVIARGGLVDVINKKLWQEIIKGLHLPSSITSAAFTLRTQYMKYLYPYECEKRRLSTPSELQAAIDGNRREGRRSSYGTYPELMQRSPGPNHPSQMSPLSLANQLRPQINGNGHLHHPVLHPSLGQPPLPAGPIPGLAPSEFEARMVEYVKLLNKELRTSATTPPTIRQGSNSPPSSTSPREALSAIEMSRLTLWNLYNNNHHTPSTPEPQKEALDLGVKEQQQQTQRQSSPQVKREPQEPISNGPPAKKLLPEEEEEEDEKVKIDGKAHIKISSKEGKGQENSLVVSMDINGIMYQGVLFAQNTTRSRSS